MSRAQSTLAFPSRKSAAPARKPAAGKQKPQSASAKKSKTSPTLTTAVVNKQLVSTPQRAEEDDGEVQLTRTRSSPRSEPIHRTNSHERTKHARDLLLPGTWTDASDNEVLLRQFDLDYAYGPCGGLSRKARWQRAQHLSLNPPQHVWDILQQLHDDDEAAEWDAERRQGGDGGAEVDEGERRKKRRKHDIDSHSIFENVTSRILEAEGRGPP